MFRVFPEALDPCFVCFTLSCSSQCNMYQWSGRGRAGVLRSEGGGSKGEGGEGGVRESGDGGEWGRVGEGG